MGSFYEFSNFVQPSRYKIFLEVLQGVLRHLDQLSRSNIQPDESEAGHDSGNGDTEGDHEEVAGAGLNEGRRQESNGNQPKVDELEALTSMEGEPVPGVSLGVRVCVLHLRRLSTFGRTL